MLGSRTKMLPFIWVNIYPLNGVGGMGRVPAKYSVVDFTGHETSKYRSEFIAETAQLKNTTFLFGS
mgnify:CR=1 FL=1